ncbi:MAG: type II secretion system F family protein [Helicobacteraceae bacterium]|jgi:general secretion pathway protein F/type IV pilus assembly protein PilC|nr:type II secretion system F family protein [Helicobacteraceae bacterium]
MLYKYRAIDQKGDRQKGAIEASSAEEAAAKLRAKGLLFDLLAPAKPSVFARVFRGRKDRIPPNDLARISRDLSIYLKAGVSIVNAIRLASTQYASDRKTAGFLSALATLLDEGKSFSQALENQSVFEIPAFFAQSIRISENGGVLQEVLLELSRFIKDQESVKKQAKNALFYPLFIVIVSICMLIFMMTVVVPQITGMFEQLGQELPSLTRFVIGVSDFIGGYWVAIAVIIAAIAIAHTIALKTNQAYRYAVHLLIIKTPLLGRITMNAELARFCYMCSVLMRSGVPFVRAIRLAANAQTNEALSSLFLKASDRLVEGGRLSVALQQSDFALDRAFIRSIALGEETSELEAILSNLSTLYFEENRDRIAVFLSLLEPALMLLVGALVGFIITAMLLPIFSMSFGV